MKVLLRIAACLSFATLLAVPGYSQTIRVQIGTVAPADSPWHKLLMRMGQRWNKASNGKVDVTVFPGTVGDENKMLKDMKLGRLQAVAMSGVGLATIDPAVGALQLPMLVDSYAALDRLRAGLEPQLEASILKEGYVVLHWSDVGWVHFFTTRPARTPADLKPMKLFITAGDLESEKLYRNLGFTPVPLAITDLLTALKTGMIEAFDIPPLFALANQSIGLAKYMIDMKWAPVIGATVIDRRTWEKIDPPLRTELLRIARATGEEMRPEIRSSGDAAVAAMKKPGQGLTVVTLKPEEMAQWRTTAKAANDRLRGTLVPADAFDRAMSLR